MTQSKPKYRVECECGFVSETIEGKGPAGVAARQHVKTDLKHRTTVTEARGRFTLQPTSWRGKRVRVSYSALDLAPLVDLDAMLPSIDVVRAPMQPTEKIGQSLNRLVYAIQSGLEIAESNAQVVGQIQGQPVTRGDLAAAFKRVEDRENWKRPIDAYVTVTGERDLLTIYEAVVFFAGCVPTITLALWSDGTVRYRVQAVGYYAAVGA